MRPNIIFITTDTQGIGMISSYVERAGVETPNIDRLAQQGVLFEHAFTTCPLCTPARSSWYTGLHPNRSGAWANDLTVHRNTPMLAELLTAEGYEVFHLGKWHLDGHGYNGAGKGDGGFDDAAWYDLTNFLDDVGRSGVNRFGGWNKGLDDENDCFGHRVADRAIDIMEQHSGQSTPFFLAVEFDEPHGPYICPPPFRGRFSQENIYKPPTFMADMTGKPKIQQDYAVFLADGRERPETFPGYYHRYYDCNSYIDYEIGRVVDAVEQFCPENTVIIYTSDHGDHLGAFGLCAKGPTMYDHTIAIPLIITAPGIEGGRRESGLVSSVDCWASILELAGISLQERGFIEKNGYSGQSLLPVLKKESESLRDAVMIEYNRFSRHNHQTDGFFPIRCIRTQEWKLNINLFDKDELYNLQEDPEEMANLIDDPSLQKIRIELHDRLLDWQEHTQDLYRNPLWSQRPWRPDYPYQFEGFMTTGYKDQWEFGALTD